MRAWPGIGGINMAFFLQLAANGIVAGMVYTLVALGLTLTFGIGRVINFAHGELYMLGAFGAVLLETVLGLPYLATIPVVAAVLAITGIVVERTVVRRLRRSSGSIWAPFMATLALLIVLQSLALLFFGPDPYLLSSPFAYTPVNLGPVTLTQQELIVTGVGGFATWLLTWFLKRTRWGLAMRAVARDPVAATLVAIDVDRVNLLTFALAAALAGLAGVLVAPRATVDPYIGRMALLKGLSVVIVGGLGNVPGAIAGGLIFGVGEAMGAGYVSASYKDALGYVLMIVVLLFRPQGIMGRALRRG